jgi:hypothetical protein
MTPKTRNRFAALFILAFPFVIALGVLIADAIRQLPPLPPLPNPNGYDVLVKAGARLHGQSVMFETMSQSDLSTLIASNSVALALARSAFTSECRVPVQFPEFYMTNQIRDLTTIRNLAQTLAADGRLAELENHTNDAVKSYLDVVRLGGESARGGFLVDGMVGVAIEGLGAAGLQKLSGELDAKSCREAASALESLDASRQSWADIVQMEGAWRCRFHPSLRSYIVVLFRHNSSATNNHKAEQAFKERQQKTRQLMIDLAARAYELDQSKKPASATDLVPTYLKSIPHDPFTGTNMVYSP